jgi:hypothetical protein
MAMSYGKDPFDYMNRMEEMMWNKQQEMEARMRAQMYGGPYNEPKQAEAPAKPSHLNPKLLLTKGA